MSTRYVWIVAVAQPFEYGLDENSRTLFSLNLEGHAATAVDAWAEELAKLIEAAGLGTLGTSMFIGRRAVIPAGSGPFVQVLNTGGGPPEETHDGARYERLGAQVVVRGASYASTETRALAIFRLLDGIRDELVTAGSASLLESGGQALLESGGVSLLEG